MVRENTQKQEDAEDETLRAAMKEVTDIVRDVMTDPSNRRITSSI